MQRGLQRKTGYYQGLTALRGAAIAGFCSKIVTLVFLYSCATSSVSQDLSNPQQALARAMAQLCLSGDGKARVTFAGKSHRVRYESRLSKIKWLLSFDFPFHGEELLQLNLGARVVPVGTFYQSLYQEAAKVGQANELKKFVQHLGQFLYFYANLDRANCTIKTVGPDKLEGTCRPFNWRLLSDKFTIWSGDNRIWIDASDNNGSYYRKLFLTHGDLQLELFIQQCRQMAD